MEHLSNLRILVTGATGFVGLRTVSKILSDTPVQKLSLAVRADSHKAAEIRFGELMMKHPQLGIQKHIDRVELIAYDGSEIPTLGLGEISRPFDALINIAADTAWDKTIEQMLSSNYAPLAKLIERGITPKHVIHCSTAFACPIEHFADHVFLEEERFPEGSKFFSTYAESKYLLERCIEENVHRSATRYTIVRPAIVGASTGRDAIPRGWATDLKAASGLYALIHPDLCVLHTAPVLTTVDANVISVDHVANTLIVALVENVLREKDSSIEYINSCPGENCHLTMGEVTGRINPKLFIPSRKVPGMRFSCEPWIEKKCQTLFGVCSIPFRFRSSKCALLLRPLLSSVDQVKFPMGWEVEDKIETYVQDCADVVARKVKAKMQSKKNFKTSLIKLRLAIAKVRHKRGLYRRVHERTK